jgi:hypothetical protein
MASKYGSAAESKVEKTVENGCDVHNSRSS